MDDDIFADLLGSKPKPVVEVPVTPESPGRLPMNATKEAKRTPEPNADATKRNANSTTPSQGDAPATPEPGISRAEMQELISASVREALDASFGKFARSLRTVLEDMGKRIDLNSGFVGELQSSLLEVKDLVISQSENLHARFTQVDQAVREVDRSVQALRDHQELHDAHAMLARYSVMGAPSSNHSAHAAQHSAGDPSDLLKPAAVSAAPATTASAPAPAPVPVAVEPTPVAAPAAAPAIVSTAPTAPPQVAPAPPAAPTLTPPLSAALVAGAPPMPLQDPRMSPQPQQPPAGYPYGPPQPPPSSPSELMPPPPYGPGAPPPPPGYMPQYVSAPGAPSHVQGSFSAPPPPQHGPGAPPPPPPPPSAFYGAPPSPHGGLGPAPNAPPPPGLSPQGSIGHMPPPPQQQPGGSMMYPGPPPPFSHTNAPPPPPPASFAPPPPPFHQQGGGGGGPLPYPQSQSGYPSYPQVSPPQPGLGGYGDTGPFRVVVGNGGPMPQGARGGGGASYSGSGGGSGGGMPAPTNAGGPVPLEVIVQDISAMGFDRGQVMAIINNLKKQGHPVELNVILDRLTRGVFT